MIERRQIEMAYRNSGRTYWYILTYNQGKVVVWHKSEWVTEAQANQAGFKALKGQMFEVVGKPWNDCARMTQEAKARHLEEKQDLNGAMKRASHVMPGEGRSYANTAPTQEAEI
jgi:hypothetical protein